MEARHKCSCGCRRPSVKLIAYHALPFGKLCEFPINNPSCFNKIKKACANNGNKCSACGKRVGPSQWKKKDYDRSDGKRITSASDYVNSGQFGNAGGAPEKRDIYTPDAQCYEAPAPTEASVDAPAPAAEKVAPYVLAAKGKVGLKARADLKDYSSQIDDMLARISKYGVEAKLGEQFDYKAVLTACEQAGNGFGRSIVAVLSGFNDKLYPHAAKAGAEVLAERLREHWSTGEILIEFDAAQKQEWTTTFRDGVIVFTCGDKITSKTYSVGEDLLNAFPTKAGELSAEVAAKFASYESNYESTLKYMAKSLGVDKVTYQVDKVVLAKLGEEHGKDPSYYLKSFFEKLHDVLKQHCYDAMVKEELVGAFTGRTIVLQPDVAGTTGWKSHFENGNIVIQCHGKQFFEKQYDAGKDLTDSL